MSLALHLLFLGGVNSPWGDFPPTRAISLLPRASPFDPFEVCVRFYPAVCELLVRQLLFCRVFLNLPSVFLSNHKFNSFITLVQGAFCHHPDLCSGSMPFTRRIRLHLISGLFPALHGKWSTSGPIDPPAFTLSSYSLLKGLPWFRQCLVLPSYLVPVVYLVAQALPFVWLLWALDALWLSLYAPSGLTPYPRSNNPSNLSLAQWAFRHSLILPWGATLAGDSSQCNSSLGLVPVFYNNKFSPVPIGSRLNKWFWYSVGKGSPFASVTLATVAYWEFISCPLVPILVVLVALGGILRLAFPLGAHRVPQSTLGRLTFLLWHVASTLSGLIKLEGCLASPVRHLFYKTLAALRQYLPVDGASLPLLSLLAQRWPWVSGEFSPPFGVALSLVKTSGTWFVPLLFCSSFRAHLLVSVKLLWRVICICRSDLCAWLLSLSCWGNLLPPPACQNAHFVLLDVRALPIKCIIAPSDFVKSGPWSSAASVAGLPSCHCLAKRLVSGQLVYLVQSEGLASLPPHGFGPCTLGVSPGILALSCSWDTLWLSPLVVASEFSDDSHLLGGVWLGFAPIGFGSWDWEAPAGFFFGPNGVPAALPCTPRGTISLGRYSAVQSASLRTLLIAGLVAASFSLPDCVVHIVHYTVWPAILAFRVPLILGFLLAPQFGRLFFLFLENLSRHSLCNILFNMASTSRSVSSSGIAPYQLDFGSVHGDRHARFNRCYHSGLVSSGACPKLSLLERSEVATPKLDQVPGSLASMRRPGLRLIWCASASLSMATVFPRANLLGGGSADNFSAPFEPFGLPVSLVREIALQTRHLFAIGSEFLCRDRLADLGKLLFVSRPAELDQATRPLAQYTVITGDATLVGGPSFVPSYNSAGRLAAARGLPFFVPRGFGPDSGLNSAFSGNSLREWPTSQLPLTRAVCSLCPY